jgi:hypothetical protein
MVLILPSNEHLNLDQVCSYFYKEGWFNILISTGLGLQFQTTVENAARLITQLDKTLGGAIQFTAPPPAKSTITRKPQSYERPSTSSDS